MLLNGLDASAEVKSVDDLAPLPEPMFEGNYEGKSQCLRGQGLQDAVVTSDVRLRAPTAPPGPFLRAWQQEIRRNPHTVQWILYC